MKYLIILLMSIFTFACQSPTESTSQPAAETKVATSNIKVPEISGLDAQNIIHSGSIKLLDVRTYKEIEAEPRIIGARNFDFNQKNFAENLDKLDPAQAWVVYCKSGARSMKACKLMKEKGFRRVYNLKGGYDDYKRQGLLVGDQ